MTLTVKYGEIGYLGYHGSGAAIANAITQFGTVCTGSVGGSITVVGQGGTPTASEKLVLDYTNGLFGQGVTSVTLDSAVLAQGNVVVLAPTTGSNIALGVNGFDLDTRAARVGGAKLDVALHWTGTVGLVTFNGSAGADAFIADAPGLTASLPGILSATWTAASNLTSVVGAAYAGALTLYGGGGNDILAGGAGLNYLYGGPGDDTFLQSSSLHAELISGGDGWDTVDYSMRSASQPVTVTLGIDGAVASVAINSGGTGYSVNDVLTLGASAPGSVSPATLKVTSVSSGVITGISVVSAGAGYPATTGASVTGGTGTGATFNILVNGVAGVSVAAGGLAYRVGDVLTVTPASGTPATVKVLSVSGTGAVTSVSILTTGGNFSVANYPYAGGGGASSTSGGSGANASITVTSLISSADDGSSGEGDSIGGTDGLGDNDVENVIGTPGPDVLDARRVHTDVVLQGGAGNDILRGGAGRDDLCGGPGNDEIFYSGCSTSFGCSTATASGDFLSGGGGYGGGAATGDSDTIDYSIAPTGVVVCLNPVDTTCGGATHPYNQNGATAGMYDVMDNTHIAVCPSARQFLISCNGTPVVYTPGAGKVTSQVATVAYNSGNQGTGYAVGDLVSIGVGNAIAQVRSLVPASTAVAALDILNAGSGYSGSTGVATTALPPSSGSGLKVDISVATTGDYTCATSPVAYAQISPSSSAETFDISNVTGHPSLANVMDCDGNGMTTMPGECTLVGGLAADTLQGSSHVDAIYGNGNGDTVYTNGGADFVDLTYSGIGVIERIDCANASPTIIYHAADTLECPKAADALGTFSDTGDQCTFASNRCSAAYFLPE